MTIRPITLEGRRVRLEPLTVNHLDGLVAVGLDERIWRWSPSQVRSRADMRAYIDSALADQQDGTSLPFATIHRGSGYVIGSTRYGNIDFENRRVEIGWTWIAPRWQRTAVNSEAKYLMLNNAFDSWGCARVEFKTDILNQPSRTAILRIGAKEEGVLRKHMLTADGRFRDSIYYSILDTEWPSVKALLENKLNM
ncbi:MAG: GNAT family N-acetyltransferase [Candidatus Krumholzibacteria bacterium]|nr:GNAT family N-acetyltransferase [Candidatus Krumholzibacteria bacterium]